jgi:hypothetical protein
MKRKNDEHTIKGVVFEDEWDDQDNVVGVGLETANGEEYIVESNEVSSQLIGLVDHLVEATGLVRERIDGDMTINVETFRSFAPHDDFLDETDDFDDDYYIDEEDDWK